MTYYFIFWINHAAGIRKSQSHKLTFNCKSLNVNRKTKNSVLKVFQFATESQIFAPIPSNAVRD
jgi:hypothetical protein